VEGSLATGSLVTGSLATGSLVTAHPELGPLLSERPQRAKLLDAMVRVVAEKGYEAATVADAVKLARVSRGTFYELFESKEACLAAAYRLGLDVLAARVTEAVRGSKDWREELQLGIRAYLRTFDAEPLFARVYLLEWAPVAAERDAAIRRFARRYGASFARGGREVPEPALYVLAAGVHELARAHVRAGERATDLEDVLVGCAVRLAAKEESWT
jgi:AcrR family transcriptional regulator